MQTVDDKTIISGLRCYTSDKYGLLITVGGRWCRWWLQSNRPATAHYTLVLQWVM